MIFFPSQNRLVSTWRDCQDAMFSLHYLEALGTRFSTEIWIIECSHYSRVLSIFFSVLNNVFVPGKQAYIIMYLVQGMENTLVNQGW